jgi:hypothetical protein
MRGQLALCFGVGVNLVLMATPGLCDSPSKAAQDLNLTPEIIKDSPVLQRWQRQVPNVLEDIRNDPSFPTKVRLGYFYLTHEQVLGVSVGVEDIFLGGTRLTVSGEYQATFNGQREAYGANLNYYLRPLGSYINVAPVVGYRYLETNSYLTDGLNLGVKLLLVLSRGGAADISLTQSWVAPGSEKEVGITTLSVGYAIARNLRISTDLQQQNAKQGKETRLGFVLEWIP